MRTRLMPVLALCLLCGACASPPEGLAAAEAGPGPEVQFDVYRLPLPEIPLPNDFASRFDALSPTKRRLNASIFAAKTQWEQHTRAELDKLTGWGTLAPITVAFTQPLDLVNIRNRHQAPADFGDDAIYVIDVTEGSPDRCKPQPIDLGQGHFPVVSPDPDYYPDEPHTAAQNLIFEDQEEDLNGNGMMDPGEDTDMDGVLDHPNRLPGQTGPFDAIGFYEGETNTLIARPLYPLREATTYAVVLTKRLTGLDGNPVRSPFPDINHRAQTGELSALPECLAGLNLSTDDVAFTWAFTTQSITYEYRAIRDGLHGIGPLASLEAQYPAELSSLDDGRIRTSATTNTVIVPGDQFLQLGTQLFTFIGGSSSDGTKKLFTDWLSFVDFLAVAHFNSPQFFPRDDAAGNLLPFYDQTFQLDPARGTAFTRAESVPMFFAVPKGRQGPAPVVIFEHGHSSSMIDALLVMGPFARAGLATLSIDAVSHGVGLEPTDRMLLDAIVQPYGVQPLANQLSSDGRAFDQNGDGIVDPGADFFTAYVMHSRDEVRQTAVDLMQLVRVIRSFDGKRHWNFDANRDGQPDLAGDFDGDGVVDFGGPNVPIYISGASLGGILSSLLGGIEPDADAIAPILPGGYLSEIGARSALGQVRNPLVLRMMGPLIMVHPDPNGQTGLFMRLPSATQNVEVQLATLPAALKPGQITVIRNGTTGEWRCGRVQPNGHLRLAVSSDKGDPLTFEVYDGELPSLAPEGCDPTHATPTLTVSSQNIDMTFEGKMYPKGTALTALGDGFGMRRGSPELRRLLGLAQVGLESADPANFAPFYDGTREFKYGDGSVVSTKAMMVPMTGDPGVPIASGVALLRAAGFVDFNNVDPVYGKTDQQVLLDTHFVEGVAHTDRFEDPNGKMVLEDVSVLEAVANADDGFNTPRLMPPLRFVKDSPLGGQVGAFFPMMNPQGQHSFPVPDPADPFDLGTLVINIFADYLGSGAAHIRFEACMERNDCDWLKPLPK